MSGSPLTGAERELQEHRGLDGHSIPWDLIAPRAPRAPRTEDRAVSSAPSDSHLQQHPNPWPRVREEPQRPPLALPCRWYATGEQNFPVITTTDVAEILAKDAAESTEADAAITAHVIAPTRLQRSYLYRREDSSQFSAAWRRRCGATCQWPFLTCSTRKYSRAQAPAQTSPAFWRRLRTAALRIGATLPPASRSPWRRQRRQARHRWKIFRRPWANAPL